MVSNFKSLIATLFITMTLSSCNGHASGFKNLNVDEFEKGIAKPDVQLVDVRTPEEYQEKHIAGAVNINIDEADFEKRINELDKSKSLYVYCLAGSRSKKAAAFAFKDGFTDVDNLENGITAWIGADKPVTTASGGAPETGMSFDDYLVHIKNPDKLVLVDFNATWCGPCKQLNPIVERQAKKNKDKVELFEVDVDKNPKVASTMKINGIPLLILYKNGKEVWRSMGLIDESELEGKLKQFIN